eukprot:Awhi_evm1s13421
MLYDSDCPLCMHEVRTLAKLSKKKGDPILFTDIARRDYNPSDFKNGNVSYETGMKRIHGVLANGEVVSGVKCFQKIYTEVGLGWIFYVCQYPVIYNVLEKAYDFWAKYRMRITGRKELDVIFRQRKTELQAMKPKDGNMCRLETHKKEPVENTQTGSD